ncbi:CotH kinase family protein [Bacteroides sp.]
MRHTFLFISLFICLGLFATNPQKGFNYQAVIRDASGMVLKEQNVTLRITVLSDNTEVYKETHQLNTSASGYVNLVIGSGTAISGTFDKIDWSSQNQFIKVELDKGSGYEEISNSALNSVPYAKYAEYVLNSDSEEFQKSINALKKTNDSLVNCIKTLKEQLKTNEESIGNLEDATASFTEYQELKGKKYTSILLPEGLGQVYIKVDLGSVSKDNPVAAKLTYNGGNGYGFKSDIEITYQGSSSMSYPKKNFSIDLDKKIKFGNWVPMDSYHLKANYIDATQARNVCMGRVVDDVANTLPFEKQRPWRSGWEENAKGNILDNGAKGHIDGFPVEVYINDKYYGLYTWNLKIHRDNYCMTKDNMKHILLKAEEHNNFYGFVSSNWEMKNPKIDGVTGAGDIPWDIQNTIARPLNWFGSVKSNPSSFKNDFANYFDKDAMIDYYIILEAFYADDDVDKNLSMCTWDGNIWYFLWYDMDTILGLYWNGSHLLSSSGSVLNSPEPGESGKRFWNMFYTAFKPEIIARWNYLKTNALSYNNVIGRFSDFMSQISQEAYERDFKKWPNIPSNSSCYTSLAQISKWYQERLVWMDTYFK